MDVKRDTSEEEHRWRINDRLHLYPSFRLAELRGPDHQRARDEDIGRISPHYHFKCSASEADEGARENKGGVSERQEDGESGLSCAEARTAKLNEHEICTVPAGASGTCVRVRVRGDSECAGFLHKGMPERVQTTSAFLHVCTR